MQSPTASKKAERHAATRAALLGAAREVFTEAGFADAGTEEIVRRAGVTRGALYYHFADKRALFEAVVEAIAHEILDAIEAEALATPSAREALIVGSRAFLDACLRPSSRRIYLVDAPAVIGWRRWRAIDARYAMGSLREGVEAAVAERPERDLDAETLTYLLSGALNEAALWIAETTDEARARALVDGQFARLIEGLFGET